jgi:hypothetical protein
MTVKIIEDDDIFLTRTEYEELQREYRDYISTKENKSIPFEQWLSDRNKQLRHEAHMAAVYNSFFRPHYNM